jgi:aspartyl-tRNA(Asn)/glutamyl-tRNA(Gln) amidotransferase subunit A
MNFSELTIKEINQGLKNKSFSAKEVTLSFLEKIKEKNNDLFCFLNVFENQAIEQAERVDEKIKRKQDISILSGIPIAVKDNILVKNEISTGGSKILENYKAPYNATVINKLQALDAVIIGKTNMDEFAMGSSTENSAFKPTKNPLNQEMVPGGSSGGSASAVKAGLCSCALGSDTGGSIRQPASFCGIVGLKPTYGSVSRNGLMAMASSLDQIGPLAKNVEDAEIIFNAISGKDEMDSTSFQINYSEYKQDIKKLKIGVPKEYFIKGMNSDIEKETKNAINEIEKAGIQIKEISLPHTDYALATYYIIMPSEVSANMSRYDGIKYGLSVKSDDLLETYFQSRKNGLGSEVKRRIILGTYVLLAGHYDAYYEKAQKVRSLITNDFEKAFQEVDLILTPSSPILPFKIKEKIDDPLSMYLSDIFTVTSNLAGVPSMSMPCGRINEFSIGMQIIGRYKEENKIFKAGKFFEKIWKQ